MSDYRSKIMNKVELLYRDKSLSPAERIENIRTQFSKFKSTPINSAV